MLNDPVARFAIQAIVIIALSRSVGLLARRWQQPMVVVEIAAGIALGPSLLGLVAPHVFTFLFPNDSLGLLNMLAEVGLILFMFLVGLELDLRALAGRTKSALVISQTSIAIPFALGVLVAFLFRAELVGSAGYSVSFLLFMGVAMSITAFPVLARILVERRLLRSRVGSMAIACAAVNDATAWCLLAFVVASARTTGIASAVRTTLFVVIYAAVMIWLVRPLLRRVGARANNREGLTQNVVAVILIGVLASSFITHRIGVHAVFGAFSLGAIMPKHDGFAHALAEKLEDLVVVLLLPLFFAYSGLRTHIGLLDSGSAWGLCALLIIVASAGKFFGSAIPARFTGLSWRESSALGILMNARGLMELVALNIGLDLGVISPRVFTMMVVVALVTTFLTTPMLERVFPASELAKVLVEADESVPVAASPTFTLLACVSNEASGPAMASLGAALVGHGSDAERFYALRLASPANRASFVLGQRASATDEMRVLVPLVERARELALSVRPLAFVSANPADDIVSVADVKHADLILLGWHKAIIGNAALGGVVHHVMSRASADVAVLVDRGLGRIGRVLVPYLGPGDAASLALSRRIAEHTGASVTVLHVIRPGRAGEQLGVQRQVNHEFYEEANGGKYQVSFKAVPHEKPALAAVEEANSGYDLVIISVGPEWALEHRSFGIQAELVITRSPCSLLVLRHGEPSAQSVPSVEMTHASRGELSTLPGGP